MLFLGFNVPRRWCSFWDKIFLGHKNFFWDANFFLGIQETFFGIHNVFLGYNISLVDPNPRTTHKKIKSNSKQKKQRFFCFLIYFYFFVSEQYFDLIFLLLAFFNFFWFFCFSDHIWPAPLLATPLLKPFFAPMGLLF